MTDWMRIAAKARSSCGSPLRNISLRATIRLSMPDIMLFKVYGSVLKTAVLLFRVLVGDCRRTDLVSRRPCLELTVVLGDCDGINVSKLRGALDGENFCRDCDWSSSNSWLSKG